MGQLYAFERPIWRNVLHRKGRYAASTSRCCASNCSASKRRQSPRFANSIWFGFCTCGEWQLQRAAARHRKPSDNVRNGPGCGMPMERVPFRVPRDLSGAFMLTYPRHAGGAHRKRTDAGRLMTARLTHIMTLARGIGHMTQHHIAGAKTERK